MLRPYTQIIRLEKPIGSLLLLWPTLMALWVAGEGHPEPMILLIFVLGVFIMRSAGCIINDFADRHYDGEVKRTRHRPLVTGDLSVHQALAFFILLMILAVSLVFFLNRLTMMLSIVAFLLAVLYPFMKRFTHFPQAVLGVAFGWSVPMAFAAQAEYLPLESWLLFIMTVCWTLAFDTEYAMVDSEDDKRIGIKSTALFFKDKAPLLIAVFQSIAIICLLALGWVCQFSQIYYMIIGFSSISFVYQHYLIRNQEPDKCFKAFLNNNYFGIGAFMALIVEFYLHPVANTF